jgi:high frequency lysogenization protein
MQKLTDKTIALAGIFQCAALVHHIAGRGSIDETDLTTCVRSTLELDPPNTLAVFGKVADLRLGLQTLTHQIGDPSPGRDIQIARYAISLMHLERKLSKDQSMLATLRERLCRAKQQSEIYGYTHDNVLANLAGIYVDTISQLRPKIMVVGDESHLTNPKHTARIRAILLAGIRAAVLWTQVGGSRWQILLQRKVFVREAQRLLDKDS